MLDSICHRLSIANFQTFGLLLNMELKGVIRPLPGNCLRRFRRGFVLFGRALRKTFGSGLYVPRFPMKNRESSTTILTATLS